MKAIDPKCFTFNCTGRMLKALLNAIVCFRLTEWGWTKYLQHLSVKHNTTQKQHKANYSRQFKILCSSLGEEMETGRGFAHKKTENQNKQVIHRPFMKWKIHSGATLINSTNSKRVCATIKQYTEGEKHPLTFTKCLRCLQRE